MFSFSSSSFSYLAGAMQCDAMINLSLAQVTSKNAQSDSKANASPERERERERLVIVPAISE